MKAAALEPPAAVAGEPAGDQVTDSATPRLADAEALTVSPSASDSVASSVLPATSIADPVAEADDDWWAWAATRLGVLLMALGLVSVLSASLPVLVGLFSRTEEAFKRKT